ncbi:MAG: efflux RND transporter periplasmic adaptor subunit [Candidatus Binataceae bacterium]|nr:efflux RND transporter periplasmic adaptor subunit [Candidatus Binataceae bacterium]
MPCAARRLLRTRGVGNRSGWQAPAAAIAALFTIATAFGCRSGASQAPTFDKPIVPVIVAAVEQKNVPYQVHEIGTVESYSTVSVEARVDGRLDQVHFKQGDEVRKGQLLFTIDPRPFQAVLDQVAAQLTRDRAQAVQAAADERRYASLLEQGVGTQAQYDQAHATAAAARATVAADEASLQTARLNLSYTTITAPIDGRTGDLKLHPGNLVKANDVSGVMVVINQIRPIYVSFSLPERQLGDVQRYMTEHQLQVTAAAPNEEQEPAHGVLAFVDNQVDPNTGTIMLKGLFANQDERLWPGEFVTVRLTLGEHLDALVIPAQAVQTGQKGSYVYVVDGHMTAQPRPIVPGDTIDNQVIVASGLHKGETVVTDGQLRLMPGSQVRIKQSLTPAPAA